MSLTTDEFRADTERVVALRSALALPIVREAMEVLNASGPATRVIASDITPTYASVRLGHVAGFVEYPTSLAQLATHPTDTAPLEEEYKREEE